MNETTPAALAPLVACGAFIRAFIFGAVGNKTNFSTMGAVSDVVNMGDWSRMRMWLLAIAVAILGANALALAGAIDLAKSIYIGACCAKPEKLLPFKTALFAAAMAA